MKKYLLILGVLLFALFASLWVYVQSEAFATRMRPFIVGPLQEALGPEARIGRIKINLLPLLLEARDLSIPGPASTPAIEIRRVRVYLNPFPLLIGRVSITSVSVLEPRIRAARSAAGETDLALLVETIRGNILRMRAAGPSRFTVVVKAVSVRNGQVFFSDQASVTRLTLKRLSGTARVRAMSGAFSVRDLSAEVRARMAEAPELSGEVKASFTFDPERVSVQAFELTAGDARITASGKIGLPPSGGTLDLALSSRIGRQALSRFVPFTKKEAQRPGLVVEAAAAVRGDWSDPSVDGTVSVKGLRFREVTLQEAGLRVTYQNKNLLVSGGKMTLARGDKRSELEELSLESEYREGGLVINRFALAARDFSLHAAGRLDGASGWDLRLIAEASGSEGLLSLALDTTPRGKVEGALLGPLASPRFDGSISAGPMTIRGVVFTRAGGRVSYENKALSLSNVEILQEGSSYRFDGAVDLAGPEPFYKARLGVIKSDVVGIVALFYKPIPLDLSASGELTFTGTSKDFSGTGSLDLGPGRAYGESFDRGTLSALLTKDRISFPNVFLVKKKGTLKGDGWIGFDGSYSARMTASGIDLSVVDLIAGTSLSGASTLTLSSSGRFAEPRAAGTLAVDDFKYRGRSFGQVSAQTELGGGVLKGSASADEGRIRAQGTLGLSTPYRWSLRTEVEADDFDPAGLFGVKEFFTKVAASAHGWALLEGRGADLSSLNGSARLSRLALSMGDYRIENEGDASFLFKDGTFVVQAFTAAGPGTRMSVSGSARLFEELDLLFTGTANLSLLRLFYREVEHGDGTADARLTVRDAWANPDVVGELRIENGLIKIKDIPQRFTGLTGMLHFDRDRIVTEGIVGEIGGGTITVSGSADLEGTALVGFSAKAAVENVVVRYPAGLTATLAGELYYDGDAAEQGLTGDVLIRRARYDKRIEWKSMLVDLSKGITQPRKTDVGWIGETRVNVRFHGADNIVLQNNLAKVPLEIDMYFRGTVNQPQVLGRIETRKGEVYFRKNVFRILRASADFVDPARVNPMLDVQAETETRGYQIRLGVTGTADRAVVTFVSDPPLTDSNILALLALGRTGEELKGKEGAVGQGEALSFATGRFQDILESRARSLTGLDRFQVDPYISKSDVSVPRVTVGKEVVQDRLFVTYSSNVGAATPEQNFRIEYLLDRHVSLVGERNETGNIGADVKFRFEFR